MSISEFFTNVLGANLSNTRWSWGAFNPETNQYFLRVWEDQIERVNGEERVLVFNRNYKGRSSGYSERARQVEAINKGAESYGVVCKAKSLKDPLSRTIKEFNSSELLKFEKLIDKGGKIHAIIESRLPVSSLAQQKTATTTQASDLKAIFGSKLGSTQKEALVNARLGQGQFRADVLKLWKYKCCVTGSSVLKAIRASHIKPWRDASNEERLDPYNGLPLIATLDVLFDAGLISFNEDGKLIISRKINSNERKLLGLKDYFLIKKPDSKTAKYLSYHREYIFINS